MRVKPHKANSPPYIASRNLHLPATADYKFKRRMVSSPSEPTVLAELDEPEEPWESVESVESADAVAGRLTVEAEESAEGMLAVA